MESAFDDIAGDYDEQFTHTSIGQLQRQLVYRYLEPFIQKNNIQNVLELNCGTGEDALWLTKQGCRVLATDISSEMIRMTQQKVKQENKENFIQTKTISIENLQQLSSNNKYDLIFSNFGGINCLDEKAIRSAVKNLSNLLRPGGHFIAVVIGKYCWWEYMYFLLKRDLKKANRRSKGIPVEANLDGQTTIKTWYYSPADFIRIFEPEFQAKAIRSIGSFVPPSYLQPAFNNKKSILNLLFNMDKISGHLKFFYNRADHFYIHFQKQQ